jgi:group II intron reverse transcriptase/maturase
MDDEDAQARSGNTPPDAADAGRGGRNPSAEGDGAEACTATQGRTKAEVATQLMEQVVERGNMWKAYERVVRNKGAPGADGMRVSELKAWLQANWVSVKAALLAGSYLPREVRAVDIPKPSGGVRTLGVPSVVDRLIQQALLQVLQPIFEPRFSESSYGFRPGRNAWQAVQAARDHVRSGKGWVADIDLAKFFDRVNHDVLMARVARAVGDARVLGVIRRFLEAGLMRDGVTQPRREGTPQGGPLSPLLSNIMLTDLDRELERRGHAFARYADDCNVYLGSRQAAEHAFEAVGHYLESELKLQVNRDKSATEGRQGQRCATAPEGENLAARETWRRPCGDNGSAEPAAAWLDELLQVCPGQGRVAGTGRLDQAQAEVPNMALRQALPRPGQDTDKARSDEGTRVAVGDQRARCLVELRSKPHERGLPQDLLRPHGARVAGRYLPALPASLMNRRMRNRTYGGVGGRRG